MKYADLVTFRDDLLFNGAVQIGWFEHDIALAEKAAKHYVFHGPDYHGVSENDYGGGLRLLDTASFTLDILQRIYGDSADEPFELAIAGYGTGKSHLGLTLACLCSQPSSKVSKEILKNLSMADASIGQEAKAQLKNAQPFLVVTLNGMQDFDLNSEIIRQILRVLNQAGLDTSVLENLRPRFRTAQVFTESFYDALISDYKKQFGDNHRLEDITEALKSQDEDTFWRVSLIYEQKMGSPIHAVGQESLHDFMRVAKEVYCGPNKSFAGILIIFDEFGRYLEFSVQKPHVAGSGALQQLFECVQANGDRVFLLSFIQYELKAYISRIAPELRDDLNRYVTRYDAVKKVRLSTNLETLIANLMEKKDQRKLQEQLLTSQEIDYIQSNMAAWFPDLRNYSLWMDNHRFTKVIVEGCWPLHPISTWILYKLSSAGKSLQQRSALSLLAEVYASFSQEVVEQGNMLVPTDFCNESLIGEFIAAERYGQQGASANAYETVISKYQYQLSTEEKLVLKAVLLSNKIGVKVESKANYLELLEQLSGVSSGLISSAVTSLEMEYGVLEWNDQLCQYEIVGEAVPRRAFLDYLERKAALISLDQRADIFAQKFSKWSEQELFSTDFGTQNNIATREWDYKIQYSNISLIKQQIDYAIKMWKEARETDQPRGHLIYCYVGANSNLDTIKEKITELLHSSLIANNVNLELGAPIVVILLHDTDGYLAQLVAEYWVLEEQMGDEEKTKFHNFILDKSNSLKLDMENQVSKLEKERHVIVATAKPIQPSRLTNMLYQVFDSIYCERITFPFDGFSTSRGNAARDCHIFTRQLFMGLLDRNWLMTQAAQQKNRGEKVFDKAWGVFDKDGSLRLKPRDANLRKIIELLESHLQPSEEDPGLLNLGFAMRLLCAPPFGCNIASAGLILALFIGKRRNNLNLLQNDQLVAIETWLSDAIQGNFLNLTVLDSTDAVIVSEETLSEWERLLEDWDAESTYNGRVEFHKKALALQEKIPVPQLLYYKYDNLADKARAAQANLNDYEQKLDDAANKIYKGNEKGNLSLLSWGASVLKDLLSLMESDDSKWTSAQVKVVQDNLAEARLQTQQMFPSWYKRQTVRSIENLGDFKQKMSSVGRNLQNLGLDEEQTLLAEHVEEIEENVRFIEELKQTVTNIKQMVDSNIVNDSTTMQTLYSWLEQVQNYAKGLETALLHTKVVESEVTDAKKMLAQFQRKCLEQVDRNKQRLVDIYDIQEVNSISQISTWKQEVALLKKIFEDDKNIEDLILVQQQLELIEDHFNILDDSELDDKQFQRILKQCQQKTDMFFDNDPPLDTEAIYGSIYESLQEKRKGLATIWMKNHVPSLKDVKQYDVTKALQTIASLQKRPKFLSTDQVSEVKQVIEACENLIDELEVEGLYVKFQGMSEKNQKAFIKKIESQIKAYINQTA
jgi:hypothetical protein